jgi:hypothetical protein
MSHPNANRPVLNEPILNEPILEISTSPGNLTISTEPYPYIRDMVFKAEHVFQNYWGSRGQILSTTPYIIIELCDENLKIHKRIISIYNLDGSYNLEYNKYKPFSVAISIVYFKKGVDDKVIAKIRKHPTLFRISNWINWRQQGVFTMYQSEPLACDQIIVTGFWQKLKTLFSYN